MYYIKNSILKINCYFYLFYGSGYPRVIEYRNGYPKLGYPETTNPGLDIKSMNPTDPNQDPGILNFSDIRIRPRLSCYTHRSGKVLVIWYRHILHFNYILTFYFLLYSDNLLNLNSDYTYLLFFMFLNKRHFNIFYTN